jgi:hypothetical protein
MKHFKSFKGPDGYAKCPNCGTEHYGFEGLIYKKFLFFWIILFCGICKTKSFAPKNVKERFNIKSKAQDYHKKDSPNWVDEKGFIQCPKCSSHNARDFWGFGGFSGHTVYLKCFDCNHNDKEHGVHVSSGL